MRILAVVSLLAMMPAAALRLQGNNHAASLDVKGSGHVSLRRRLGLALKAGQSLVGPSSVASYAAYYQKELRARQAIFFTHVSRSAGTLFCMCSWASNCRSYGEPGQGDNCEPENFGEQWGGGVSRPAEDDTCSSLVKYVSANDYTVVADENYLLSEGLCPQFWNVIIVRDPIARVVSHASYFYRDDDDPEHMQYAPNRVTLAKIFDEFPLIADNFYTRSLLGKEGYALPFGMVTSAHMEKAKKVLEGYDLVLLHGSSLTHQLKTLLGWTCDSEMEGFENLANRSASTTHVAYEDILKNHWSRADWALLEQQNALDAKLFAYAQELAELDRSVFESRDFTAHAGCDDGRCGYFCK